MNLQEAIEKVGEESEGSERMARVMEHGYSGRGMYGKECPAISGSWSECQRFCAEVSKVLLNDISDTARNDEELEEEIALTQLQRKVDEAAELVEALWDFSTDQLGRDIVLYWPNETYSHKQEF